jgi:hypothetical protein
MNIKINKRNISASFSMLFSQEFKFFATFGKCTDAFLYNVPFHILKVHTVSLRPWLVSECQLIVIGISYTVRFTIDHNRSSCLDENFFSRICMYRGTNTSGSSTFPPLSYLIAQRTRSASVTKNNHCNGDLHVLFDVHMSVHSKYLLFLPAAQAAGSNIGLTIPERCMYSFVLLTMGGGTAWNM